MTDDADVPHGSDATPAAPRRPTRLTALGVLGALALVAGGLVAWAVARGNGKPEPPPLPPGAVTIDVWAPYWTLGDTVDEATERLADVREVSPFWFGVHGVTSILTAQHADSRRADEFLDAVDRTPARLVPSLLDEMPAGGMAAILADPVRRARHVEAIVDFADDLGAAGIDIDYEQFAFADGRSSWEATRPGWVAFVEELAAALHSDGRTLSISIPPVYDAERTDSSGYWVYDHGAIAEFADSIRIMGYDYSTAEAGPIAPLDWVRRVVDGVSEAVPREYHGKLVLGVPAYGANWVVDTAGTCPSSAEGKTTVSVRSVPELARRRGGSPEYDAGFGEWRFDYELTVEDATTSCVQSREVRWVGAEGVQERAEIARRAGWGGVALWALGYEDDAAWAALITAARAPLAAAP